MKIKIKTVISGSPVPGTVKADICILKVILFSKKKKITLFFFFSLKEGYEYVTISDDLKTHKRLAIKEEIKLHRNLVFRN